MQNAAKVHGQPAPAVQIFRPSAEPGIRLIDFLHHHYRPDRLPTSPGTTLAAYANGVRNLQRCVNFAGDVGRLREEGLDAQRIATRLRVAISAVESQAERPGSPPREVFLSDLAYTTIIHCRGWVLEIGDSVATANKVARHLATLWRYAVEEDWLPGPLRRIRRLREDNRKPKAWRIDQFAKILQAAREVRGEICGICAARWWTALLLLGYDTGLRISALMSLRWEHFDDRQGEIFVPASDQKDNEEQQHALSLQALAAVRAVRSEHAEICPWPFDPPRPTGRRDWRTLRDHLRRHILRPAGLPCESREDGGFHKYRKTNASYLKKNGGDPTEQLGHSGPQVTERYLDPTICRRRRQVDLLPRPKLKKDDRQLRLF